MLASNLGILSAQGETTQCPRSVHSFFGEEAGFTGEWRLAAVKDRGEARV
jgi:hypothetical protein